MGTPIGRDHPQDFDYKDYIHEKIESENQEQNQRQAAANQNLEKQYQRGEDKSSELEKENLQMYYYQEGYTWHDAEKLARIHRIAQDDYEKENESIPFNEEFMQAAIERTIKRYVETHGIEKENNRHR